MTTWRRLFRSPGIAEALVQFLGLVLLWEPYTPTTLCRRAQNLRQFSGNGGLRAASDLCDESLARLLPTAPVRPSRLNCSARSLSSRSWPRPYSNYSASSTSYSPRSTFPAVWQGVRGESAAAAAVLRHLALGVDLVPGAQLNAHAADAMCERLRHRDGGAVGPQFRLPLTHLGSCLIRAGLFGYHWGVDARAHFVVPDFGVAVPCLQAVRVYPINDYGRSAACYGQQASRLGCSGAVSVLIQWWMAKGEGYVCGWLSRL